MGMPNIDDITAKFKLDYKQVLKLLMTSVALEELGLAHMINAEGEKMQDYLSLSDLTKEDYLKLNTKVTEFLKHAAVKEKTLGEKLESVKYFLEYLSEFYSSSSYGKHKKDC